jgi:polyvinyl alcohol dehydrogenase (cytochrome)
VLLLPFCPLSIARSSGSPNGEAIFERKCAVCHRAGSNTGAPVSEVLRAKSRESILAALNSGTMRAQGNLLEEGERESVAEYLAGGNGNGQHLRIGSCAASKPNLLPGQDPVWNGWGVDSFNTRFQPAMAARLSREQVPRLKLRWAFGFQGAGATFGQPTVVGGRVFVGSEDGTVYALDALTGCIYWAYKAAGTVKTATSVSADGRIAYFGDTLANVYALAASSGTLLWKVRVDPHPVARITGSPLLFENRLYVPVSSGEEGAALDPRYPCCTFRGNVVALDARTGKMIWKTYTIPQPSRVIGRKNPAGVDLWGPAGAAVWSPPTLDPKRRVIYVATGNSYSDSANSYSDAVIALEIGSGKMLWWEQFTSDDHWNIACVAPDTSNCPQERGEDLDFGSPPILRLLPGNRRLLIVAQKSGVVRALDPDRRGKVVWQARIGRGGPLGGVEWGGGADDHQAYFPLSDWEDSKPYAGGGLFALNIATGEKAWYVPPAKPDCADQPGCSAAQMAPVTVIPGVVFSGSMDGHLRAYDASDGKVVWDFNTAREFQTVDGVPARGGSLNATGPAVVDGVLYVNSGYTNGIPGNVLLAFSIGGNQ